MQVGNTNKFALAKTKQACCDILVVTGYTIHNGLWLNSLFVVSWMNNLNNILFDVYMRYKHL